MNKFIRCLKRPFVWLRRIRHRCGYGVHSPFAFNLITNVVYESIPYYKYAELEAAEKRMTACWGEETMKLKRLLFRLVNYVQPHMVVDAGLPSASALYLKAGKTDAFYVPLKPGLAWTMPEEGQSVDFLYLHHCRDSAFATDVLRLCMARTTAQSLFVIEGIHYTRAMRRLWRSIQTDHRVRVTFDLYDVGLVFFDSSKSKQDYIVNF